MNESSHRLSGMTAEQAAVYVMDNDISDVLEHAEVVRDRPTAKIVTALRIDLASQAELEAAASARGIGASTLMRNIIEEWLEANRDGPTVDQVGELVRHLDAARRAADSIARAAAA